MAMSGKGIPGRGKHESGHRGRKTGMSLTGKSGFVHSSCVEQRIPDGKWWELRREELKQLKRVFTAMLRT